MKKEQPIIISIVEDEMLIGQSLKDFINEQKDYCCDNHYPRAMDALEGIPSCRPHIVIMDIGLPDMNGVACMRKLKEQLPQTHFIMFTVFDADEMLFDALKIGAAGYILKDDSFENILAAIEEVMKGGGPMSPSIAKKVIMSFDRKDQLNILERLTPHQKEILGMIARGLLNKEIADHLNIVEGSVKNQIRTIYTKLQVNNRVEASSLYRDLN